LLSKVLGIESGDVISLVGAGGKTTTMFRLAQELSQLSSEKILTTTTTKILKPQNTQTDELMICKRLDLLLKELSLNSEQRLTAAKKVINGNKLVGFEPEWIDRVVNEYQDEEITIIVEADGSACKDFKIPNRQEPVIPVSTDLLLPVVGCRIVNKVVNDLNIHRFSLLNKINQKFVTGQKVTKDIIVETLLSTEGYDLLAKQNEYEVIPLLNQVDTKERYSFALEIAKDLVKAGIKKVLLTAVKRKKSIIKVVE